MEQPKGWSWQDRAEGSIRRGTALDPSVEPVDGVRAFPTAYLQERLLITQDQENGQEEYDQEIHELREAAGSFGWNLEIESPDAVRAAGPLVPGVPGFVRARLTTPDEPTRGESPVPPDAWRVLQRARRSSGTVSYTHLTLPTIYSV